LYGFVLPLADINLLISSWDRPGDFGAVPWGCISSPFRSASRPAHNGIDIAYYLTGLQTKIGNRNRPIHAVQDGTATVGWQSGGAGNYVSIYHGSPHNVYSRYFHMIAPPPISNGFVTQGQVIGYVGNTGNSFGDHLHFEVQPAGRDWINPVLALTGAIDPDDPDYPGDPGNVLIRRKKMPFIFYLKNR